jgi:hypothetical protein
MNISDLQRRVLARKKPAIPLLDEFPNAAAAYSLRLLSSSYTGNCIEVRRSSDNSLQNIGFVNGVLDTASLLSFVGAGNGFVRTWYDQSGLGVNGVQNTNASQPQIVENGNIILINNKPSIIFINKSLIHTINNTGISGLHSFFSVTQVFVHINYNGVLLMGNNADSTGGFIINTKLGSTTQNWGTFQSFDRPSTINIGDQNTYLLTMIRNTIVNSQGNFFTNGNSTGNYGGTSGAGLNTIGSTNASQYSSEIIFYKSDQSTNRNGIESNINAYYNIF